MTIVTSCLSLLALGLRKELKVFLKEHLKNQSSWNACWFFEVGGSNYVAK